MRLNADILFDNLKGTLAVEMIGQATEELCLERPAFLTEAGRELLENHLYVVRAERLPHRVPIESGVTIVCLGDAPQLTYYKSRCCVLRVTGNADLLQTFNLVQEIFNRYDRWRDALQVILDQNASIDEMLAVSQGIFENPMFVIDANFRYLAYTENHPPATEPQWPPNDSENLGLQTLGQFLELHEPSMHVREPLLLKLLNTTTLNCNLFVNGEYKGCLTIDYRAREHRKSDIALGKVLAGVIELALQKFSGLLTDDHSQLRKVLQDVVDGMPVDYEQRRSLEAVEGGKEFVCVKMRLSNRFAKLPLGYIANRVEAEFPRSIAFARKGDILCFIESEAIQSKGGAFSDALKESLLPFVDSMDLRVGVSDVFNDLFSARLYYHQASAALENGGLLDPAGKYYVFQDYALTEMIINSLGRLPTELFFTEGLRRLKKHDADSPVSYLETLRVYLDNNMSVTKTSADLFVHRSTLLERIARIERELDTDLKDPDERLRIQMLLKAMRIHGAIHSVPENKE